MFLLTDQERGPETGEVEGLATRTPFSRFLPYLAFDEEEGWYHNSDNTYGRLYECRPLNFLTEKASEALASLLRLDWAEDTVIQFVLYPDDHIDPILDHYQSLKVRPMDIASEAGKRYADHLSEGRDGVRKMGDIRLRNYRLFACIKAGKQLGSDQVALLEEALSQAGLAPTIMPPQKLLGWLRRVFNQHVPTHPEVYDPARYIRDQAIQAETAVEPFRGGLKLGNRRACCLTPKSMPSPIDSLMVNQLIGGYKGMEDDASQLTFRFLWTTTVFFKSKPSEIRRKANIMMAQKAGGSIAKTLGNRVSELNWVLDDMEDHPYCNVVTSMWVFGEDEAELDSAAARARSLWEKQQFVMQREVYIAEAMFIAALPFGFYLTPKNISTLDRDFVVSNQAAARLLPVQGDFRGSNRPILLYMGRKGQLASLDLFDEGANNHNFLVCAETGAGKSFQTNFLVSNYYAANALIRLVDIGGSYEKQCGMVGGRYIDIGEHRKEICLNPFPSGAKDIEDQKGEETTTASVLLMMIYSSTGAVDVTETHWSLVKDALRFAIKRDGGLEGINHVYEYLSTYPKYSEIEGLEQFAPLAREMAFNLRDFTTQGKYGDLFNGESTLDFSSDEFVVVELENIMSDRELFSVIAMQCIDGITRDLYLSDRSRMRFMLFDEAWKYFGSAPMIATIIEDGYRRARKYSGSTGIVTQSPLDLEKFGKAGDIMKGNSAFKFFLQSGDYEEACRRGVLDYSGLLLDLAKGIRNNKPRYSEILFHTPFGAGVGRLCVDPWTYWMNTSTGPETNQFKALLAKGRTPVEAITELAGT